MWKSFLRRHYNINHQGHELPKMVSFPTCSRGDVKKGAKKATFLFSVYYFCCFSVFYHCLQKENFYQFNSQFKKLFTIISVLLNNVFLWLLSQGGLEEIFHQALLLLSVLVPTSTAFGSLSVHLELYLNPSKPRISCQWIRKADTTPQVRMTATALLRREMSSTIGRSASLSSPPSEATPLNSES